MVSDIYLDIVITCGFAVIAGPLIIIESHLRRIADSVEKLPESIQTAIGQGIGQGADYAAGLWLNHR